VTTGQGWGQSQDFLTSRTVHKVEDSPREPHPSHAVKAAVYLPVVGQTAVDVSGRINTRLMTVMGAIFSQVVLAGTPATGRRGLMIRRGMGQRITGLFHAAAGLSAAAWRRIVNDHVWLPAPSTDVWNTQIKKLNPLTRRWTTWRSRPFRVDSLVYCIGTPKTFLALWAHQQLN